MESARSLLERNGYLVNRKFRAYLLPMVATAIAISLNEFVDSLLVANLLDANAMALINVGSPVMLAICAVYVLMGVGGSTLYAVHLGRREMDRAGRVFSVSLLTAAVASLLFMILGLALLDPISRLLCADEALRLLLPGYLRVLFLSAPLIICLLVFSSFLPAAGSPSLATAINIIANVVNLLCDYVYIRFFGMGVEGAAWATMTGYAVCLVLVAVLLLRKKISVQKTLPSPRDFKLLGQISMQGGANALTQLGYALKFAFFNGLTVALGGSPALIAFSVCIQAISIMSIGLQGIADAMLPIVATLYGQKDRRGIRAVLKISNQYVFAVSTLLVILFEIFPGILFTLYQVSEPAVLLVAKPALRIFLLMFVVRALYILLPYYVRVIGYRTYAILISLLEGTAFPVVLGLLLSRLFGLTGVWAAFPAACVLSLGFVVLGNRVIEKKSHGKYAGFYLYETPNGEEDLCDITVTENDDRISDMSDTVIRFCETHGVDGRTATHVGLLAEEMAVYTRQHHNKTAYIDVMTRVTETGITMEFRSDGTPFNPLVGGEEDLPENIALLQKMSSSITYDYILGMNSTRITLDRK